LSSCAVPIISLLLLCHYMNNEELNCWIIIKRAMELVQRDYFPREGSPYHMATLAEKIYRYCPKHTSPSLNLFLYTACHLLYFQYITIQNWNLSTVLTRNNTKENNNINLRAHDTTALHPKVFLTGIQWILSQKCNRFIPPPQHHHSQGQSYFHKSVSQQQNSNTFHWACTVPETIPNTTKFPAYILQEVKRARLNGVMKHAW